MIPVAGRRKGVVQPPAERVALTGDGLDRESAAGVAPAPENAQPATTAGRTPFFLDFDDDALLPAVSTAPAAAPPSRRAEGMKAHTPAACGTLSAQQGELQSELQRVKGELLCIEKRIKLLESGDEELCHDVRTLEISLCVKKEATGRVALMGTEVKEALKLRQQRLHEELHCLKKQEGANLSSVVRRQYEAELERVKVLVEEHNASLLSLSERRKYMDTSISGSDPYEHVLASLQEVLERSIHNFSGSICVRVKPILLQSIRETVVQSIQQRLDIFSNDVKRRSEELKSFRDVMQKEFSKFQEKRRAEHRSGFDSFFTSAVLKTRSALEKRLAALALNFAEKQRTIAAELYGSFQRANDEMVRRFEEDVSLLVKRQEEELKRTKEQCGAELAHHSRLCASEKDMATRALREREEKENNKVSSATPVYKLVEQRVASIHERVVQLQHDVSFSTREISSKYSGAGDELQFIHEKEVMLKECEQRTCWLQQQLYGQWQQFMSATASLEQCVGSMDKTLREGRVKVATMLQAVDAAYRAWCQEARRELSNCLASSGVTSSSDEIQSGVSLMTQISEGTLAQLHMLRATQSENMANSRLFWSDVAEELEALFRQHDASENALFAVFAMYDRLARATAEAEAKRKVLEVAQSDFEAAKNTLEKERIAFSEQLEGAQRLGMNLRGEASQLERKKKKRGVAHGGYKDCHFYTLREGSAEANAQHLEASQSC